MKKEFNKKISFGKIDYNGVGRKLNRVEIEISLRPNHGCYEFSASGSVWNSTHTDLETGGQCLDSISPFFKDNELYNEILSLWKKYHLNGLHAGTKKQTKLLEEYEKTHKDFKWDYDECCSILREKDLYWDKLGTSEKLSYADHNVTSEHYGYGLGWILWKIPTKDLNRIKKLFE